MLYTFRQFTVRLETAEEQIENLGKGDTSQGVNLLFYQNGHEYFLDEHQIEFLEQIKSENPDLLTILVEQLIADEAPVMDEDVGLLGYITLVIDTCSKELLVYDASKDPLHGIGRLTQYQKENP